MLHNIIQRSAPPRNRTVTGPRLQPRISQPEFPAKNVLVPPFTARYLARADWVVVQFDCHPEQAAFCAARDLGEPRHASRFLRRINGAFGSLPFSNCTTTADCYSFAKRFACCRIRCSQLVAIRTCSKGLVDSVRFNNPQLDATLEEI